MLLLRDSPDQAVLVATLLRMVTSDYSTTLPFFRWQGSLIILCIIVCPVPGNVFSTNDTLINQTTLLGITIPEAFPGKL